MCCHLSSCRPSGFLSWMASWLTFPICPIISAPLAAISVIRAVRSGSAYAMTRSALLSPFLIVTLCVTVRTAADYSHGQAVWHAMPKCCSGEQAASAPIGWSVDPRTRLDVSPKPPQGHQRFTWWVSNRVAKNLVKLFGPQKGSWRGSLPGKEQAGRAFRTGRDAEPVDLTAFPELAGVFGHRALMRLNQPIGMTDIVLGPVMTNNAGSRLRIADFYGLTLVGTGEQFFIVVDPSTNLEVARYGDPSR